MKYHQLRASRSPCAKNSTAQGRPCETRLLPAIVLGGAIWGILAVMVSLL